MRYFLVTEFQDAIQNADFVITKGLFTLTMELKERPADVLCQDIGCARMSKIYLSSAFLYVCVSLFPST